MDIGFNAVMVENEGMSLYEYRDLVCRVVKLAARRSVSVEAQVGELPSGQKSGKGDITDPEIARTFVGDTGVDALGVSVGNVHILTNGEASIDLEALDSIHEAVALPLVLHGGTGLREHAGLAIQRGVAKFNFGTVLKQSFLAAMKERLADYAEPMNPHPFLGMGGPQDVMVAGRQAMAAKVKDILVCFRSAGKAHTKRAGDKEAAVNN